MGLYGSRDKAEEMVVTQRAALVGYYIGIGGCFTTQEVAEIAGTTYDGAHKLMDKVSSTLPIYRDDDGVWRRLE
jgi:hypothetical protein